MTKSQRDRSLFSHQDHDYYNLPTYETDEQKQALVNPYGALSYVDSYGINQPYQYWNPSMEQMPYVQYPSTVLYQPYEYQTSQPSYPQNIPLPAAPVPQVSDKKISARLPPAPLGYTPRKSTTTVVYPTPLHAITAPPHYNQAPPYYNHVSPYYNHVSPDYNHVSPYYNQVPPHYNQALPSYYYSRSPPLSLPNHDYNRTSLPAIPRTGRHRKSDYVDRFRREDPVIMSYFGRRHDFDTYRKRNRWYQ